MIQRPDRARVNVDRSSSESAVWVALGLIVAPLVFLFLIAALVHSQNQQGAAERDKQADAVRAYLLDRQRALLYSYATWDDFYESVVFELDGAWYDVNVGAAVGASEDRDATLLVDGAGTPLLGSLGSSSVVWDPAEVFVGQPVEATLDRPRAQGQRIATVFARTADGEVAVLGVARVQPHSSDVDTAPDDPERYLVFVDRLDAAEIERLRELFAWPDLDVWLDEPAEAVSLALLGIDGLAVGALAWSPVYPGHDALRDIAPALIFGIALVFATMVASFVYVRRTHRSLARAADEAARAANYDALTGLLNRRGLLVEATRWAPERSMSLVMFDLEGFKDLNERLGFAAGDAILRHVAERLREFAAQQQGDTTLIARTGPDEFVLLSESDAVTAQRIARLGMERIAVPVPVQGHAVELGAVAGVAVCGADEPAARASACDSNAVATDEPRRDHAEGAAAAADADGRGRAAVLLRRGTLAVAESRRWGAGGITLWDRGFEQAAEEERQLAKQIETGLEQGQFWVALQPCLDVETGRIAAFEALVRWAHPTWGEVRPDRFIPVAERSRSIHVLGQFVLREACNTLRDLNDVGLAVNVSPTQLLDARFADKLLAELQAFDVPAQRLEVEITEGHLIADESRVERVIGQLREAGVRIALDDFGVGYASLGYLRRFKFDKIKIDRSYIKDVVTSSKARGLVVAMGTIAAAYGSTLVAEGVETEEQAVLLAGLGVPVLQGYLIGRPLATPVSHVAPRVIDAVRRGQSATNMPGLRA